MMEYFVIHFVLSYITESVIVDLQQENSMKKMIMNYPTKQLVLLLMLYEGVE